MRRGRAWMIVAAVTFSVGAIAWANREALVLSNYGAKLQTRSLAEQEALIKPFLHIFPPATGAAPFPVVIQFHGCAGYRDDFMEQWAKVGTDNGFLVVGVDSHGPRGIDRDRAFASVCTGEELIGQERAGDVAAAIALVKARDDIDPDHIVIAGWSHGAWTAMDYLTLHERNQTPPSLTGDLPEDLGVAGAILFYPYCGPGGWARIGGWPKTLATRVFIAGKDSIVDSEECRSLFQRLTRQGADIDVVYYPDADHVFDDRGLEEEYRYMFNEKDADDAERRYGAFLADRLAD